MTMVPKMVLMSLMEVKVHAVVQCLIIDCSALSENFKLNKINYSLIFAMEYPGLTPYIIERFNEEFSKIAAEFNRKQ